jgi:Polyketide cyclase / dehydrase and lipid transport
MHTISLGRAETRSISIAAPPETVLELLGDARRLPDWAPAFAVAVEPAGPDWLVDSGAGQLRLRVRVSPEHGTVDLLRPDDPNRGARMRVLSNEDGSEFLFTLIFPAAADDTSIAQQMTVVEAELRTVRDLCEAKFSGITRPF